jgi:ribose 5-phosphate isomerase B
VNNLRVAVGSDSAGLEYKSLIADQFRKDPKISQVVEVNPDEVIEENYPGVAFKVAQMIVSGEVDRALLICGTGMGMAISANKVKGIRACTAHDSYSVERLVMSNNAQILCLGQRVIGPELAKKLAQEWLEYEFNEASKSATKVAEISEYESRHL